MIVYADVLFAVNMLMDITIIWAAGMLLRERIRLFGIIAGGAAGALMYIAVLYMPYINGLIQVSVTLMCMTLSLIIAYRPKSILRLIKLLAASVAVSFVLAGIIVAIVCMKAFYVRGSTFDFSYRTLIFSSLAVYVSVKAGRGVMSKAVLDKKEYFDIKIFAQNREILLRALQDTGNSLTDSLCGHDIVIAEYDMAKKLFPQINGLTGDGVDMFSKLSDTELKTRLRLIPFKSIGNTNGMLLGIRADRAEVETGRGQPFQKENIIVAVYKGNLDSGRNFNAIVSHEILRGSIYD